MGKFETNSIDVRGDGKVILFHRSDVVSNPKYQCRISVDGATGYVRFSTKTSSREEAERIALDKYFELKNKVDKGGSLKVRQSNKSLKNGKSISRLNLLIELKKILKEIQ